ncbi:Ubiquitin, putative [Perkinsus marinus ATCC 50983]|uniref:Ubiquitin, putative n=4 Tax=Perkinsus marinus TaxID=31276 RepID=C5KBY9_PERM5|nr:Ubiquitin, putative [Perkinsus marinus ATCC 50983]EER18020.1 Ubiquitin, putative [Perkinsus marinus ATCC 50983]|eukprot:XP_002786224.1 Ubiquitin, putative [Perkinsus marinus ATCC 50983]
MQVITSVAGGRPILMDAEGEQLIAELIIELADKTGLDRGNMKIAFNGKIMDDDDTLRECGIEDLSTVRVLLPLKGGHIPHPVKYVGPRRYGRYVYGMNRPPVLRQVKDWIDWTGWNSVFGGFSFQVAFGLMIVSGVYLNNYRATHTLYYTNKPDNQDILGH